METLKKISLFKDLTNQELKSVKGGATNKPACVCSCINGLGTWITYNGSGTCSGTGVIYTDYCDEAGARCVQA